jgi:hypothetical protein
MYLKTPTVARKDYAIETTKSNQYNPMDFFCKTNC